MIFRTRPHGHHPRFCSSVTSTARLSADYVCKETCAPSQSQTQTGSSGGLSSQDGVSQWQDDASLNIPQINCLVEVSIVWDESSTSNTVVPVIPSQHMITLQILSLCQHFRDLKLMFVVSRRAEQLSLCS
jgi:hypothetical protein